MSEDMAATAAVTGRRSVRRFLPTPVPQDTIHGILDGAARAPSGTNLQPWLAHVVSGEARDRLARAGRETAAVDRFRAPMLARSDTRSATHRVPDPAHVEFGGEFVLLQPGAGGAVARFGSLADDVGHP